MAEYKEKQRSDCPFPHMDIYELLRDGVCTGYEARTEAGYVMYNTTAKETELDPATGEEVPVTYYYVRRGFPAMYNFANFPWVAVPRDTVEERYIFGGSK